MRLAALLLAFAATGFLRRLPAEATPLQIKSFKRVGDEIFATFAVCGKR